MEEREKQREKRMNILREKQKNEYVKYSESVFVK
jgi:hypothetical protein